MKIVIIDYGSGNLQSVINALQKIDNKSEIKISNKKEDLRQASHIILPGVGAFKDCIEGLKKQEGLLEELRTQVLKEQKPFLGICVGMQVLASIGEEDGQTQGLGLIDGKVKKLSFTPEKKLKIPQMGWNSLIFKQKHPVLKEIPENSDVYFANSYYFSCQNEGNIIAQVEYGQKINAIIAKKNILGIQFHPEKSGEIGLKILKNFLDWRF